MKMNNKNHFCNVNSLPFWGSGRWLLLFLPLLFASCKSDDDQTETSAAVTVTVNVDVILPQAQQKEWEHVIDDALKFIDRAQSSCRKRVRLNLRYHDEDNEDLGKLAYALTRPGKGDERYVQPDTCHAIIGPYHSSNARIILDQAHRLRLPVVMPVCTSAELQRSEARQTNSFFLTESDITQCEVLLTMMKEMGHQRVALLYTNDNYGNSFRDWFGFLAAQSGLNVIPGGIRAYADGDDLSNFFSMMQQANTANTVPAVILALGRSDLYPKVLEAAMNFYENISQPSFYVSDTGLMPEVMAYPVAGSYPVGSAEGGFLQAYHTRFGTNPPYGAAQMYDALSIIALGRAAQLQAPNPDILYIDNERVEYETTPKGPVLCDWMRAVLASGKTAPIAQLTPSDMASAFHYIEDGTMPNINGATGPMNFDSHTYTTILNTSYLVWKSDNGKMVPVATVSTNGYGSISTKSMWDWQAIVEELEDIETVEHKLPDVRERWAVVISPSTTWQNYRHQADAFSMYQVLRHHGYDDDHIVLIVEDNLADDERNPFKGEIFVERSASNTNSENPDPFINDNVRSHSVVDYHFSDLRGPDDLADIIMGVQSQRLPHVILPTETDNILIFWSGHGADNGGPLWGNEDCQQTFGTQRIRNILDRMQSPRRYRRMLLAIETCYSGQWGEALTGTPDVLVLTAANAFETSKPDVFDVDVKTFLSNAFSRTFRRIVDEQPSISLRDIYYSLARTTSGSHVTLYNVENYGSVYHNTMDDYIVK